MIKAVIIDDEPAGREALQLAIENFCPKVNVLAICGDPLTGIQSINTHLPDLVFLDVLMPIMTGFDMLRKLGQYDFKVIFVSAHSRYAEKAFRFSALDFVPKPIDIDILQQAIAKTNTPEQRISLDAALANIESYEKNLGKLAIPSQEGLIFITKSEISFCKSESNYTDIFRHGASKMVVSRTLADFESILSDDGFIRVHNSYLINAGKIRKYVKGEGGHVVMESGETIPISRRRKEYFLNKLNHFGLCL